MVLDNSSSPHRRSQNLLSSSSFRKQYRDEFGSLSTLVRRHCFLLTMLTFLAFLCSIYLYFAITLVATESCSGLTGAQKASCQLKEAKAFVSKGKLKFF
ncbi:uncharacterized protein LOC122645471 [Telopea speciosissima]|uniref:uncharacterized protein LOC122645471 n=1 Tax=Telopea speciosissima TaxID=54955 RepID=UPI001CC8167F|nr:uncharacterized protein LOC122645471 [Telopea speciosissima]XP_043694717.1 uncharacterized protein LOC122645471 [Telopea speciosissima]